MQFSKYLKLALITTSLSASLCWSASFAADTSYTPNYKRMLDFNLEYLDYSGPYYQDDPYPQDYVAPVLPFFKAGDKFFFNDHSINKLKQNFFSGAKERGISNEKSLRAYLIDLGITTKEEQDFTVAICADAGFMIKRDIERAIELYASLANIDARAANNLAIIYLTGESGENNIAQGQKYLQMAIAANLPIATYNAAVVNFREIGTQQDMTKIEQFLIESFKNGFIYSGYALGAFYQAGALGSHAQNNDEADFYLSFSNAAGVAYSQYLSAQSLQFSNPKASYKLLQAAADAGLNDAIVELGTRFYFSDPEKQDFTKAYALFSKGAQQGSAAAIYYLGLMQKNGQGVAQNIEKGTSLIQKSCELGFEPACFDDEEFE